MLQKKRGFTLVELLVVIAISAIVLTMVGTSMVFVANTSGKLIQEAEDIDMAKNIEKYLRGLIKENNVNLSELITSQENSVIYNQVFKIENGKLIEKNKENTIFTDTGLTEFEIFSENDFLKCKMVFDSGKEFEFILGVLQNDTNDENNENSGEVQE